MTEALADLLRRVEEATGADHKLDELIFAWDRGWSFPLYGAAREEFDKLRRDGVPLAVTSSIDAAVALAERVLPGWKWLVRTDDAKGAFANISERGQHPFKSHPTYATTPALALCAAILKAKAGSQ